MKLVSGEADLKQVELLEFLELRRKQVSTCPQIQNLFYLQYVEQKISQSVGEQENVFCSAETAEV